MPNETRLDTFPSNRSEALTMLYLQNQDLTGKSPSEIVELYLSTNVEIKEAFRKAPRPSAQSSFFK